MTPTKPTWPYWLLGLWLVLSVVYIKVYLHARAEFYKAEQKLSQGKLLPAIRHYSRVIRWYTPGNRYVSVSIRRLLRLGDHAYTRGDWEQAISAYQQLRNGLTSLRSVYQPHAGTLDDCQHRLARVLSHLSAPTHGGTKSLRRKARELRILDQLHASEPVASWGSFAVIFFYLGWLATAFWCCWSWTSWAPKLRLLWGLSALGCFGMWVFFLRLI